MLKKLYRLKIYYKNARNWTPIVTLALFCAIFDIPASYFTTLIFLFTAAVACFTAHSILNGEISAIRENFTEEVAQALNIVISLFVFFASIFFACLAKEIPRIAHYLSGCTNTLKPTCTNGDEDLMEALIVTTVLAVTLSLFSFLQKSLINGETGKEKWKRSVELRNATLLAVVGLVPAATLQNWAWNVLAAVLIPIFLIAGQGIDEEIPGENSGSQLDSTGGGEVQAPMEPAPPKGQPENGDSV